MGLPCMNCQQPVDPNNAQVFSGVFVCPTCFTMATRLFDRSKKELNDLLLMLQEGIRIALIEGRLQFREGPDVGLSKKEVLEAIVKLQEMSDARKVDSRSSASLGPQPKP